MKNIVIFVLWFVSFTYGKAQVDGRNCAVYIDAAAGSVKLFLGSQQLPVSRVDEVATVPLNVVFLLDGAPHQEALMRMAKDYVARLAADLHVRQANYAVVLSGNSPYVVAQGRTADELISQLNKADQNTAASEGNSEGLYNGASIAAGLLEHSTGNRALVVLSDDDDDIDKGRMNDLKSQLARAHIRCFSILLANRGFFGSKVRPAGGIHLNSLAKFSGGAQFETDWQNRKADSCTLAKTVERMRAGTLISFELPEHTTTPAGTYSLKVQLSGNGRTLTSTPFAISR